MNGVQLNIRFDERDSSKYLISFDLCGLRHKEWFFFHSLYFSIYKIDTFFDEITDRSHHRFNMNYTADGRTKQRKPIHTHTQRCDVIEKKVAYE